MKPFLSALSFWTSLRVTPGKIVSYLESLAANDPVEPPALGEAQGRISCVQMRVHGYKGLRGYLSELMSLARSAAHAGAQMIVYPEYVGLLAGTLLPSFDRLLYWAMEGRMPEGLEQVEISQQRVQALAETFQSYLYETYMYTFSTIARLMNIYIAAGSCLFYEQGKLYNRCVVFDPQGEPVGAQDKLTALRFDRAVGVTPADKIEVFDLPFGKLSILFGTDACYFETFKIARELGAQMVVVPDVHGERIRDLLICRANESGIFAFYSCYSDPKADTARASIISPVALTADRSGLMACASNSRTGIVSMRANLERLARAHPQGEPNPTFLANDYLHSYLYCGKFAPDFAGTAQSLQELQKPFYTATL